MKQFAEIDIKHALTSIDNMFDALNIYNQGRITWAMNGDQLEAWERDEDGSLAHTYILDAIRQQQLLDGINAAFNQVMGNSQHPQDILYVFYILLGFYEVR
jgi:hypothetical protein